MAKQLELPDGRNLDYVVVGKEDGFPLIWCHGTPSGYTAIPALESACEKQGFKLVTFSRAGYGGSSRRKGRSIVADVDDVRALLKHLGHEQCVVGGWSGGGPHALACAAKLECCLAVVAVAAVAPYNVEGLDWYALLGSCSHLILYDANDSTLLCPGWLVKAKIVCLELMHSVSTADDHDRYRRN